MSEQPLTNRATWLQGPDVDCRTVPGRPARPFRVILLGAPGIGKGTQAAKICEAFQACHLSTGDVFRQALKSTCGVSPAMEEALQYMKRGDLVPDETVIKIVHERARCLSCSFGFLLDGFPRTVAQAEALDVEMDRMNQRIDAVLEYVLPLDQIVARLSGRRTCPDCKATYHVETLKPKVEGVCDKCGGQLVQREDDQPEVVKNRMAIYSQQTAPLSAYYKQKGILVEISADGAPDDVFARTRGVFEGIA